MKGMSWATIPYLEMMLRVLPKAPKQAQYHLGNPILPLMWFQECNKDHKYALMFDKAPLCDLISEENPDAVTNHLH